MEGKKKICFISTIDLAIFWYLKNQLKAFQKKYEVTVITNTKDLDYLKKNGLDIRVINVSFERKILIFSDLCSLFKLIRIFIEEDFFCVQSVQPKAGLLVAIAAKIAKVNKRIHIFTGQGWALKKGLSRNFFKFLDKIIVRLNTHILVDSKSQLKFLEDEMIITKHKNARVLGAGSICGVDTEKFKKNENAREKIRKKYGIEKDEIVFGFIGRLCYEKGIEELLEAFHKLDVKKKKLFLAGHNEGILSSKIENKDIIYVGYVENPEYYFNAIDIFCLPSHREGFGLVLIEAAANELPTIATNITGIIDAVEDWVTGLLYEVKNVEDLKNKMEFFIKNKDKIKEFGLNGRKRVCDNFSSKRIVEEWLKFYEKILIE